MFPRFTRAIGRLHGDESGATAIEYAVIASCISIVIVGIVTAVGADIKDLYASVATALK